MAKKSMIVKQQKPQKYITKHNQQHERYFVKSKNWQELSRGSDMISDCGFFYAPKNKEDLQWQYLDWNALGTTRL